MSPSTETLGDWLHKKKYRQEGESFEGAMNRIATTLAPKSKKFNEILQERRFLPAGRIQASIGIDNRQVTALNCFVSGIINDSLVGTASIMDRAEEAAVTMKMGGGIGYDFSTLRPTGTTIKSLLSSSSGPVSFMGIFDAVGKAISSAGHRRGAQMGIMRVDHPDILKFVRAKQNTDSLTGFNISVGITDKFMQCLKKGELFPLMWDYEEQFRIDPRDLWAEIMGSTWDWAEPGVVFLDTINEMNNLYYCEEIHATNPCSEQPLPPYGACLLGSFNLVKYLEKTWDGIGLVMNFNQLEDDIVEVIPAMDAVIENTCFPLVAQKKEAENKRRMGIGITGLANALEATGLTYGSDEFIEIEEEILRTLRDGAYERSSDLAKERGKFPLYSDAYTKSRFIEQLPPYLIEKIEKQGMRNSHLTSIAPTGTISLSSGENVSSGIEPVYSLSYDRTIRTDNGQEVFEIEDYGSRVLGVDGKTVDECTLDDHLRVLRATVPYIDSATSKTINIPATCNREEFENVYFSAYNFGAKGCSTFRVGGKRGGILASKEKQEEEDPLVCEIDEKTGKISCD